MKTFLKSFLKAEHSTSALIIRLVLAIVILPHGLQKTLGLFGGYGFSGTMGYFTGQLGIPTAIAFLVIMAESLGAIALGLGFLTRFCAASLAVLMLGAIQFGHFENGFFMNWYGNQKGEGFEYHLLVIGMCVSLLFSGAGRFSIDKIISEKMK